MPTGQVGTKGYDLAGNLTDDSYTGAGTRVYDAENWMTSAVIGINTSATYTYDADGRRTRRQTPTENVWQVYGIEGELLAEYAANGAPASPQKEYGYRNGELLITASGGRAVRIGPNCCERELLTTPPPYCACRFPLLNRLNDCTKASKRTGPAIRNALLTRASTMLMRGLSICE